MNSFQTALSAVLPIVILLALGIFLRKNGMLDQHSLNQMNLLGFKVLIPVSLYYNIVTADISEVFDGRLLLFALASQVAVLGISVVLSLAAERTWKRRGAVAQGILHTNFIIFGTMLGTALCGEGNLGSVSLLIAAVVPVQNIFSVIVLERFRNHGGVKLKMMFGSLLKNPYVIAALAGFATQLLPFSLPVPALNILRDIGRCAGPVALIVMGGLFNFGSVKNNIKPLAVGVMARLAAVPAMMLPIAAWMGFRGNPMVGLMCLFCAPTAAASFSLASAMDSDADLASQLVVFTSLCSLLTLFCWIYGLSGLGYI